MTTMYPSLPDVEDTIDETPIVELEKVISGNNIIPKERGTISIVEQKIKQILRLPPSFPQ